MTATIDRPGARPKRRGTGRTASGGTGRTAAPDPRLRARQVAVARAAGRHRLRFVCGALAIGALVASALVVLHSPLLAARHVSVVGARQTTRAQILAATGLDRQPPLVDVSTVAASTALERLPWVAKATVTLRWPTGVAIALTERHAVAEIATSSGSYALVDPTGRVLEDVAVRVAGLALVVDAGAVPVPGETVGASLRAVVVAAGAVPVSMLTRVASLHAGTGGVVLELRGGPRVLLGSASSLRAKMVSLATVLARVPMTHVVAIDLRVPADPVLTSG